MKEELTQMKELLFKIRHKIKVTDYYTILGKLNHYSAVEVTKND